MYSYNGPLSLWQPSLLLTVYFLQQKWEKPDDKYVTVELFQWKIKIIIKQNTNSLCSQYDTVVIELQYLLNFKQFDTYNGT